MAFLDKTLQKGLYSKDWQERQNAVKETEDLKTLKKIALTDDNWLVRSEAIKKIDDEDLLEEITQNDKNID